MQVQYLKLQMEDQPDDPQLEIDDLVLVGDALGDGQLETIPVGRLCTGQRNAALLTALRSRWPHAERQFVGEGLPRVMCAYSATASDGTRRIRLVFPGFLRYFTHPVIVDLVYLIVDANGAMLRHEEEVQDASRISAPAAARH